MYISPTARSAIVASFGLEKIHNNPNALYAVTSVEIRRKQILLHESFVFICLLISPSNKTFNIKIFFLFDRLPGDAVRSPGSLQNMICKLNLFMNALILILASFLFR